MDFDAQEVTRILISETRKFLQASLSKPKVVIGISGGKDSAVAAAICAEAIGPENVLGVMLPNGVQPDIDDSLNVCRSLGIRYTTVNISKAYEGLMEAVLGCGDETVGKDAEAAINVSPRLRMTALRYLAQQQGALLCGTGNRSESYVGYCTKDGDTSCDFNPLGTLTSLEVIKVGDCLEKCPPEVIHKTPSDGLSGKSDEERLGVTYRQIHDVIRKGSSGDGAADEIIEKKHRSSAHKRRLPVVIGEGMIC